MNTLIKSNIQSVLNLENKIVVKNGVIEQTPDLVNFLQVAKELETQIKASYSFLESEMVKYNVRGIKGDWGSLTLAERLNWQAIAKVQPKFYKKTLDTAKLKAYYVAMNKLPAGIDVSTTTYLTKRLKV